MVVALFLFLEGCSSSYQPARSPRIATLMEGGTYTLVRDGKRYPVGMFGGGLEDAVEGNAEAEEHAHAFRNLLIAGTATTVLGLGSEIGGLVITADNSGFGGDSGRGAAGAALVFSGAVAVVVGLVLTASAQPHLWDAVNAYNDGVEGSWRVPPPPVPPPTFPAAAPPPTFPAAAPPPPGVR